MSTALEGIKILDFTRFQAGPTGTVLLSDLGAEVIKVEIPGRGEQGRYIYPVPGAAHTPYFVAHDRGKLGITVDYGKPEGLEILYRIGASCDVVVENFRPGQADAIGLGYDRFLPANPKLVYASVSAYGERGPLAAHSGFDIHGQAMGGIMSVAGSDDASYTAGPAVGDQLAGMTLVSAILAALLARERQGIGQKVAVSLYGCQLALQAWEIDHCSLSGKLPPKGGTSHPMLHESGMIWGSFATGQGDIVLGGLGGDRWAAFCDLLGIDPGPAADASASFTADKSAFRPLIERKLREHSADEWLPLFRERDLMISKVNNYAEILSDPQARANGYVIEMDGLAAGPARVVGSPFQLSQTPVQPKGPPPELGQHTEEVLLDCGYGWEDIARLRESGVI